MLTVADHIISALLVALLLATFWASRSGLLRGSLLRRMAVRGVWSVMCMGLVIIGWAGQGRSLGSLGLGVPGSRGEFVGIGIAVAWGCVAAWAAREATNGSLECEACRYEMMQRVTWGLWGYGTRVPAYAPALVCFPSIAEELVCRGWLLWYCASLAVLMFGDPAAALMQGEGAMGWSQLPAWAVWSGVGASSVIFGLLHGTRRRIGPVIFALAGGAAAGALTVLTASLWPAIVLHVGQNAAMEGMSLRLSRMPLPSADAKHLEE